MNKRIIKSTISDKEIRRVKGMGFLRDKTTADCFNARVITRNGRVSAKEMSVITEAAERFGNGQITLTVRLTLEIQHIPFENIEPLRAFLEANQLQIGGTGAKIRSVVSCKGTTCQYGLIDTFAVSQDIYEQFFLKYNNVQLPHKFKIAVGGCPNNCTKPNLNDIGIMGQRKPKLESEKCRDCKVCRLEVVCPTNAMKVNDGCITLDQNACINCGRCYQQCPFNVTTAAIEGYALYIGGRWGKKITIARPINHLFLSPSEVYIMIDKIILLYREQGRRGERFSETIERIGFDTVCTQLFDDSILERKMDILASNDM